MVTTQTQQGSATIYQFPVGGRAGLQTTKTDTVTATESRDIALTDAWYHQEAIREAQQATKQ